MDIVGHVHARWKALKLNVSDGKINHARIDRKKRRRKIAQEAKLNSLPALFPQAYLPQSNYSKLLFQEGTTSLKIFDWLLSMRMRIMVSLLHFFMIMLFIPSLLAMEREKKKQIVAMYYPDGKKDLQRIREMTFTYSGFPMQRPYDAYRYDSKSFFVRRRHARVAKHFGISAFAYVYNWNSKLRGRTPERKNVMDLMLEDGEPDIPFIPAWIATGDEELHQGTPKWVDPMFAVNHFEYLMRFFKHPRCMKRDGKPVLMVDSTILMEPRATEVFSSWQVMARQADLGGLYVIQLDPQRNSQNEQADSSEPPLSPAAATVPWLDDELEEADISRWYWYKLRVRGNITANSFFSISTSFNDAPKRGTDRRTVRMVHPAAFEVRLREKLALTSKGGLLLVHAWNNWGEGLAVEPSAEFGLQWLRAIKHALRDDRRNVLFPKVPLAGLPPPETADRRLGTASHTQNLKLRETAKVRIRKGTSLEKNSESFSNEGKVCVLVRTFHGQGDNSIYRFRDMLRTMLRQMNRNLRIIVFNTDDDSFTNIERTIQETQREVPLAKRVQIVVAQTRPRAYTAYLSSYDITDEVIHKEVLPERSGCEYFTVTNGDNFYSSDAFNILPSKSQNMMIMNFFGRYNLVNAVVYGREKSDKGPVVDCCDRMKSYGCMDSMPAIGYVDLGSIIFRVSAWRSTGLNFTKFNGACKYNSCHDGALVRYAVTDLGWKFGQHPVGACAFYHNPNPLSCKMVGGYYYDAATYREAGCYRRPTDMNLPQQSIDWTKFIANDGCVCAKEEFHPKVLSPKTFDARDYKKRYPDVGQKYKDAHSLWFHFSKYGKEEGRTAKTKSYKIDH